MTFREFAEALGAWLAMVIVMAALGLIGMVLR